MDISIIIPAFNESHKIALDVHAAAGFIDAHFQSGEVIIVDDGSEDETAMHAQVSKLPASVTLHIIRYYPNRGKGYAVRSGMMKSSGRVAMFADSGLCIPFEDALRGMELLKTGQCDLAHGSRRRPNSTILKKHLRIRRITSTFFQRFIKSVMQLPTELTDTQCGFKMYRGDVARELYGEAITDGFQFDVEIILRALHKGYRIAEFPVEWTADPDSRLEVGKMPSAILRELLNLKKQLGHLR
ncbi:MAG: glycosyltransferase [Calditrichaeota bacterium]|nr:MAG: glycosyltransferase [Calditrichota bacterium]